MQDLLEVKHELNMFSQLFSELSRYIGAYTLIHKEQNCDLTRPCNAYLLSKEGVIIRVEIPAERSEFYCEVETKTLTLSEGISELLILLEKEELFSRIACMYAGQHPCQSVSDLRKIETTWAST